MPITEWMMVCAFHPHIATDRWCTKCARSACEACLRKVDFGQHCVGCAEGRRAPGEPRQVMTNVRAALAAGVTLPPARLPAVWHDQQLRPGVMFIGLMACFIVACVFAAGIGSFDPVQPALATKAAAISVVLSGALVGLMLHEWAHAVVAYRGGDDSVVDKGYLTMDVRRYTQPALSIGFPLACVALGGLPLPGGAVWIDTEALKSKYWDSAVSAAGPAMSLLFAAALFGLSGITGALPVLSAALAFLALIQVGLVILNLLPVPGLDGYGIVEPHLSEEIRSALAPVKQYGVFVLMALILATPALGFIWDWARTIALQLGVDPLRPALGQLLTRL